MNNLPTSDLAYRFEYADGSAFEVYVDGRAFLDLCERGKEEKFGKISNRIPLLLGRIAKPRQDEIERLRKALEEINAQAVCFAIATEEECFQMLENCAEISEKALSPVPRPDQTSGEKC